jgi:gamma-glutamyltranspeptidase/glutathione hydrolase
MPRQITASTAAVATHHPLGVAAGAEMLREGGNAVDAAVAAMLALCVVVPGSVGLGGYGGSAIIRLAGRRENKPGSNKRRPTESGEVVAIDFGSCAPLAFREGLVTADPDSSYYGARSVTVPGVAAGLDRILREHGTKSWRDVSQPAIRLAEEGFEVDAEHRRHFDRCVPKFDKQSLKNLFSSGSLPPIGDRWQQPDLARLLSRLADEGPAALYHGEIPNRIVRFLEERGGILQESDFSSYHPRFVDPIHIAYRGFEIYTPPPPSGGITSLAIVQTMEPFFATEQIEPWSGRYFHLLAEAMKSCWRERYEYLGDPSRVSIPKEELLSEQSAAARAENIRRRTPRSATLSLRPESPHTSNVIAIDGVGNLISLTATQGWMYGSHLVVDGLGLVLNHGMSRFDYSPGHANAPAPGKRMQHNMSPMIALGDGRPAFAFGMPGGPKIVSVTAQLVLNAIALGVSPAAAIAAPRLHTDGGEPLLVSPRMPEHVVRELADWGHQIRHEDDMGGPVNVLAVDPQSATIEVASGEGTGDVAGF